MKRVLAFLLVFGAGLAALFFLQKEQDEQRQDVPTPVEPQDPDFGLIPVAAEEGATEAEQVSSDETPDEDQVIAGRAGFRGKTEYVRYDEETGETRFTLNAEDSHTLPDGRVELIDVTVTYPGLGELVAKRGLVALKQSGALSLKTNLESHIELDDGVLTLDATHALAPATFTSPKIEGDLDTQVFYLKESPQLTSKALLLTGDEIELQLLEHRVAIRGQARADVLDESGLPARSLTGKTLELVELDPEHIHMQADGDAELVVATTKADASSISLVAPSLGLDAVRTASGDKAEAVDGEFALTDIQVSGGRGELRASEAIVTGEAFAFEFDEHGEAGRVTVTGKPSAEFPAHLAGGVDLSQLAVDEDEVIMLDSDDELVLTLDRDLEILTRGPSSLRFADLALLSGLGFEGYSDEAKHHLHLLGSGGVTLAGTLPPNSKGVRRTIDYTADELTLDHVAFEGGSRVALDSQGQTTADLQSPAASAHFTADRSLKLVLNNEAGVSSWSIPLASGLEFQLVAGGVRTEGSADQVQDFEPERLRFDGSGLSFKRFSIEPEDEHDPLALSASGAHVRAHGEDDLEIQGNAETPARLGRAGLHVSARSLVRKGSRFTAEGAVHAEVGEDELRSTFDCKRLTVEGLDLEGQATEWPTAKRLLAEGDVTSSALLAGQRVGLSAASVEVLNMGEDRLELHARDQVHMTLDEEVAAWSVLSDRLDAFGNGTESNPPADGSNWLEFAARDNVVVREESTDFYGRGSALFLERGPHSRVLLEGGEEPAWVSSRLPNGAFYKGRVTQLKIEDEVLTIEDLKGSIKGVFLPGDPKGVMASDLEVESDHFTALVESNAGQITDVVQLDGNVLLSRKREPAPGDTESVVLRDTLRAEHATFSHRRHDEFGDAETGSHAFDVENTSFLAHGQVVLKSGYLFQATGDHLVVERGSQMLRMEGAPAAITFGGFCTMNTWVAFDLDNMGIESGKGFVCQDPAIIRRLRSGEEK